MKCNQLKFSLPKYIVVLLLVVIELYVYFDFIVDVGAEMPFLSLSNVVMVMSALLYLVSAPLYSC